MDLVDGHQPRAGQHRVDRAAAVLGDRGAVVAAAPADVEAGDHALRDAAAPAEEAVRHAVERGGADRPRRSLKAAAA